MYTTRVTKGKKKKKNTEKSQPFFFFTFEFFNFHFLFIFQVDFSFFLFFLFYFNFIVCHYPFRFTISCIRRECVLFFFFFFLFYKFISSFNTLHICYYELFSNLFFFLGDVVEFFVL